MQSPIGPFSGPIRPSWNFDEAIIEAQIVSQTVLPSLGIFPIIWKIIHNKFINIRQRQHFLRALKQGHGGQSDVTIRRFLFPVAISCRSGHSGIICLFQVVSTWTNFTFRTRFHEFFCEGNFSWDNFSLGHGQCNWGENQLSDFYYCLVTLSLHKGVTSRARAPRSIEIQGGTVGPLAPGSFEEKLCFCFESRLTIGASARFLGQKWASARAINFLVKFTGSVRDLSYSVKAWLAHNEIVEYEDHWKWTLGISIKFS